MLSQCLIERPNHLSHWAAHPTIFHGGVRLFFRVALDVKKPGRFQMFGSLVGLTLKYKVQLPMAPFDGPEFIFNIEKKAFSG